MSKDLAINAADWLSDPRVAVMTPEQEGAYFRLMCYAWKNDDCSLPSDDAQLAVMSRLGDRWFDGSGEAIKHMFNMCSGLFVHEGLLAAKNRLLDLSMTRRRAGLKSGLARRYASGNKCSTSVEHVFEDVHDRDYIISVSSSNSSSKKKSKAFIKPSLDEVKAYCAERNNKVNPHAFVDFYESKGWLVGKSPMKDWKASVRTWEKNSRSGNSQFEFTYIPDNERGKSNGQSAVR